MSTVGQYLGFAEKLVTDFVDRTGAAAATMRMGFNRAVENMPVSQFIAFFARPAAGRELMDAALQLEDAAYRREAPHLPNLPPEARTIIGLAADYAGLDRRQVLQRASATSAARGTAAADTSRATGGREAPATKVEDERPSRLL